MEVEEGFHEEGSLTSFPTTVGGHPPFELEVTESALLVFTNFLDKIGETVRQTMHVLQSLPQTSMDSPRRSSRLQKSQKSSLESTSAAASCAPDHSSTMKVTLNSFWNF